MSKRPRQPQVDKVKAHTKFEESENNMETEQYM